MRTVLSPGSAGVYAPGVICCFPKVEISLPTFPSLHFTVLDLEDILDFHSPFWGPTK